MKPELTIISAIRNLHADKSLSPQQALDALEEIGSEVDALCDALKEEIED